MIFQMFFYLSLLVLIISVIYIMIKKFNINYLYLTFSLSVMTMINLDGIRLNNQLFSSMDIVITAILMIIFLITLLIKKTKILPFFIFFILYLLNSFLSVYISPVFFESFKFFLRQLFFFVFIITIMNYKMSFKEIYRLIKMWLYSSIIPSIAALIQVFTSTGVEIIEDIGKNSLTRGYGFASHPNFLAYYLMMILLISFILYFEKKLIINKKIFYIILAIDFTAFLFTFSRGALIGLIFGLMLYFSIRNIKKIIYTPIILITALFIPGVGNRLSELFNLKTLLTDSSFSWRINNWIELINLFDYKVLLFGNGFKSSIYYLRYTAHNEYLGFLFENGLIGFLSFYLFLVFLLIYFIKKYKISQSDEKIFYLSGIILVAVGFFVALADNFFINPSSVFYFWFYSGIVLNIGFNNKKHI